jgi:PAS domain S-box-containing protein
MTDSASHTLAARPAKEQNSPEARRTMTSPVDPLDPRAGASGDGPNAGVGPAERRVRLGRPTSPRFFAEHHQPRSTRVLPSSAHGPGAEPETDGGDSAGTEYPPDLVFIVRADGTVLYVNRPLGKRGEEEVIGSDLYDWIFPEQHLLVREAMARVFSAGHADGLELSGIQQHDADASYECRIAPNVRDGKVVSATIIARDVTRYKRTQRALEAEHADLRRLLDERTADLAQARADLGREATERDAATAELARFRTLLDAAGEAIFVTDPATDALVDLNETACRWLRRPRAELVGQNVRTLGLEFPVVQPLAFDVQFTETRDSRRPLVLEGVHRRLDGSTFPVEVAIASHDVAGTEYVLAVVRDVKGRRHAADALAECEARYAALLEQALDAIYLTTRAGEIVEANAAALELFGYRRSEFVGLDARAIMPRVEDVRRFQRQMAEQGAVARLEAELRRRDGAVFPGLVSAVRRKDGQGRMLGYQWIVRSLAERAIAGGADPDLTGTALVVEADPETRASVELALARAGLTVVTAPAAPAALQLLRARGREVAVAVIGTIPEGTPEDVARDLSAVAPGLRIILTTADEPELVAARTHDLVLAGCLRPPVHPLALLQLVRDALGAHAAS